MRVPALLPMPRVPELISMPTRTGAIHFGRVAFSTAGKKSKEAAFAGIADEKDISRIVAALQAAAAKGDADLFKRLTKFIEDHGERQQVIERVARRNQTVMILGGVLVEIVVIVLGSVVLLGPVVFDYVKGRVHEMIREEDAKVSIWHTIDNVFGYFGNKIASPFIVFARGVAVAGNQVRRAGRKVGVWLYVMKEEEVIAEVPAANTPEEVPAYFKRFWSMEGTDLKGLMDDKLVMNMGQASCVGLAFGSVHGAGEVNSMLHDGPKVGSSVKYHPLIRTTKVMGNYAAYLAVAGATFVGVEQALARYRMKKDIVNGVAAGAIFGFRVGSLRTAFFSGFVLALTSVLPDVTGMRAANGEKATSSHPVKWNSSIRGILYLNKCLVE